MRRIASEREPACTVIEIYSDLGVHRETDPTGGTESEDKGHGFSKLELRGKANRIQIDVLPACTGVRIVYDWASWTETGMRQGPGHRASMGRHAFHEKALGLSVFCLGKATCYF